MAFRKRFRRRRGRGKKLSGNEKKQVKGMIKRVVPMPEIKAVAQNYNLGIISNSVGTFFHFIGPTLGPGNPWSIGAGYSQRIGTEIWVKEVVASWSEYVPAGSLGTSYRVIMFVDTEGNNTTTMYGTNEPFFNNTPSTAGFSSLSHINYDYVGRGKRWHILHDKVFTNVIADPGVSPVDGRMHYRKMRFKFPFKGMKVTLTGSDLAAGNEICTGNQIYMWFCAVGTVAPVVNPQQIQSNEMRYCVYYTDA